MADKTVEFAKQITGGRRRLLLGAAAVLGAPALLAQERWPAKPVKIIVAFPPGQASDIYARVFAERLTRSWGQNVVVDNRPGASGIIGMEAIKSSTPDGYTLGIGGSGPVAINPSVFSRLPYDSRKDFSPIALAFVSPLVVLANNELPARNVGELVALMKQQPGRLSYASGGPGTSQHLAAELIKIATGTFAVHIPYKGSGPALNDLIGGQVQFMVDSVSAALAHIQSGRVRALAVTSLQRNASLPNVPTVAESGLAGLNGFEAVGWAGLIGPAGLPPAVREKVTRDFIEVLHDEAVVQRVNGSGSLVRPLPGPQFAKFIDEEIAKWGRAAHASNTKLD